MDCCGWICRQKTDTSQAEVNFTDLPQELKERIFRHLTATDLCRLALCNRILRALTNQDAMWRPLCRKKGWERYGTICDLSKEPPFKPTSSQHQKPGEGGAPTFPADAVVTRSDWPGLVDTCKWKEVYTKARHLEENLRNQRYYAMSLELCPPDVLPCALCDVLLVNIAGEGDCLVAGLNIGLLQIWDLSSGKRQHLILVNVSSSPDALKMKNDIIAAGCRDGKIRTYSAQTGEQLQVMSGHRLAVSHLFFDGDTIVSVARPQVKRLEYADSDIRVWSAANGASRCILQSGHEATRLLHLDYKDKIVAGAYSDNTIRIWDVRNGSLIMQHVVCDTINLTSCHLWDGIVVGASKDHTVKISELNSGECTKTFNVDVLPNPDTEVRYMLSDGLLVVVKLDVHHGFNIVNLNGERLLTDAGRHVNPLWFRGNTLLTHGIVTHDDAQGYELWIIDPEDRMDGNASGSSMTKAPQYLGGTSVVCAWMSDTKVAFQRKQSQFYTPTDDVCVHHYW
ncbi:uncharacterized WD repeat-containing protein all2124-like [Patiria miniata]|uniref:F-box domain-containing protein n=1 Tax=Patiria miniata TaxID=46514 RepID=A0A914A9Z6_PATMI|nr:uncharacterized WD repeat-containing protein all2124-like [Patiria miniata]